MEHLPQHISGHLQRCASLGTDDTDDDEEDDDLMILKLPVNTSDHGFVLIVDYCL